MDKTREKYKTTCRLMEWFLIVQAVVLVLVAGWLGFNKSKSLLIQCIVKVQLLPLFSMFLVALSMILVGAHDLEERDEDVDNIHVVRDYGGIFLSFIIIFAFVVAIIEFLHCHANM